MFALALLLFVFSISPQKTWIVGHGTIPTIEQALEKAKNGDLIQIHHGIYEISKTIRVEKSVSIIGVGNPVLDGLNKQEILVIAAPNVHVEGITFRNSGFSSYEDIAALRLYQCRNASVVGNTFQNTFFGIYSEFSTNCRVENNTLTSTAKGETVSGNGIHAWKTDSLVVRNNTVSGHRDGIYFEFVTNSLVEKNHSFGNVRYGLHFMFSNDDAYLDNLFEKNDAGIAVMYSRHVTMLRNQFLQNEGDAAYGILLKDISDSKVESNTFQKNTVGIVMEGSSRIHVAKNQFLRNGWAIKIQASCDDVVVEQNNFVGNSFDVATNGSLVLNRFSNNFWDKYEGFDLNQDGTGDVAHTPTSLFAVLVERNPVSMMLFRSAIVHLLDKTEKLLPSMTPEGLKDFSPSVKPHVL